VEIDFNIVGTGKILLQKFESKEMGAADFDKEIAYWMLDYPDDLKCLSYPTPPADVLDYYRKKKADPQWQIRESFWLQPHIRKYMAAEAHVRAKNSGNKHWLGIMKASIPVEDKLAHKKVEDILCRYPKLDV
jgi:hypothetical protein